jgi:hypothetical protein
MGNGACESWSTFRRGSPGGTRGGRQVRVLRSASSGLGGAAGESGAEVGKGVALDLAVGFFSAAELGDGAHFA